MPAPRSLRQPLCRVLATQATCTSQQMPFHVGSGAAPSCPQAGPTLLPQFPWRGLSAARAPRAARLLCTCCPGSSGSPCSPPVPPGENRGAGSSPGAPPDPPASLSHDELPEGSFTSTSSVPAPGRQAGSAGRLAGVNHKNMSTEFS